MMSAVDAKAALTQAYSALNAGAFKEAEALARHVDSNAAPRDRVEALFIISEIALGQGKLQSAATAIQSALKTDPGNPLLRFQGAKIDIVKGDTPSGIAKAKSLAEALKEERGDLVVRLTAPLGGLLAQLGEHQSARSVYEAGYRVEPRTKAIALGYAAELRFFGEVDAAKTVYKALLEFDPQPSGVLYQYATLRTATPADNHVEVLQAQLKEEQEWRAQVELGYALGKELEDLGRLSDAFHAFAAAAQVKRKNTVYNVDDDISVMKEIASAFPSTPTLEVTDENQSPQPIFIVGLPRTGSTLIDRILSSHSEVTSRGELGDFARALVGECQRCFGKADDRAALVHQSTNVDYAKVAAAYLAGAGRGVNTQYFIDKLPFNFLYLGLIHRAFPNAKIIHTMRHPVDTAYAIYKTLFGQAYPFSYDLTDLARYYEGYYGLMDHWRQTLPLGVLFDIRYEDLIADQSTITRKLSAFCNLPWEEGMLNFHENTAPSDTASAVQVRQPLHTKSVGLHRQLEKELAPFADYIGERRVS